ncbi:Crp/Fnr family transcriptional regulator [Streptomyces sp. NBC_00887]|uniref:Crp/Fnr family transcriptional regulator n=1 Tax=Streptomyces sp. NBC_00887 TaxID=2975859 RepID=UPI002F90CBF1|nr:Crp/Fnr family transcriptional regulator [Streptomyces sp. NBC_00887]
MTAYEAEQESPWFTAPSGSSENFLASTSLPQAASWLVRAGRVVRRQRGTMLSYGHEWVHIVDEGCVMETTPHGTQRIWSAGAVIGDLTSVTRPHEHPRKSAAGARVELLADSTLISVTARTLNQALAEEPHLALLFLQLANDRAALLESVYSTNNVTSTARVAKLLDYLAEGGEERSWKYTRRSLKLIPAGMYVVDGPSQGDIANALGLSRATVEKALGKLREEGTVKAPERGTRTNRFYEIEDIRRLRTIARGF